MTVHVVTPEDPYLPVAGEVRVFLGGTIDLAQRRLDSELAKGT